jgi:DNA-directed RNA polymerase subunit F
MISEQKIVTLAEARELLKGLKTEKAIAVADFIKKFTKLDAKEAVEFKEALHDLGITKLSEEDIVKLVDLVPEDSSDVRKISTGNLTLDQNEIEKILGVFRKK